MITGNSDVSMAVAGHESRRVGLHREARRPRRAARQRGTRSGAVAGHDQAVGLARGCGRAGRKLTARQRQIMDMVLAGHPSKNIAADLSISQRTVENHRASIMKKMGAKSLPALARLALAAASDSHD